MYKHLSFYVLRHKTAVLLYILITLAISGVIIGIVLARERHMETAITWCILATAVFSAAAYWLYMQQRITVSIEGDDKLLTISINDRKLPDPMYIQTPFTMCRQWMVDFQRRGIQTKKLYITIIDPLGQPVLTFIGGLSAIQTPPANFQFLDRGESKHLVLAEHCYDTMKVIEISDVLGEK